MRLNRLHPEITKTKLRAALTLCDGDSAESLRLINACMKKFHMKTLSSPSCNPTVVVDDDDDDDEGDDFQLHPPDEVYLQADINQNSITIYNSSSATQDNNNNINKNCQLLPPLGSFPNRSGMKPIAKMCNVSDSSASTDKRTTETAESMGSEMNSPDGEYLIF